MAEEMQVTGDKGKMEPRQLAAERMTAQLKKSVKALQAQHVLHPAGLVFSDKNTNSFCYAVEAVFLHGLKGAKPSKPNKWCFWELLTAVTHRGILAQIDKLSHVSTDIGRCRAWIRMAINGNDLEIYLSLIAANTELLHKYYESWAFLRDVERCSFLTTILQGLEKVQFCLSFNSSILNLWTGGAPELAGLISLGFEMPLKLVSDKPQPIGSSSSSSSVETVDADRDESFDDFDLLQDERNEITQMFHNCSMSGGPGVICQKINPALKLDEDKVCKSIAKALDTAPSKDCVLFGIQVLTPGKYFKSRSLEDHSSPIHVLPRRQRADSLTFYRAALNNTLRHVKPKQQEKQDTQKKVRKSAKDCECGSFERRAARRASLSDMDNAAVSVPCRPHTECRDIIQTKRSPDSGFSSLRSNAGSVVDLSSDLTSSFSKRCTTLPVINASDISSSSSSSEESDDENQSQGSSSDVFFDCPRRPVRQPELPRKHRRSDTESSDGSDHDCCSTSSKSSNEATHRVNSDDEWIVIDSSDKDYIAEPFHVDETTEHMMPFVTSQSPVNAIQQDRGRCRACDQPITEADSRICSLTGGFYCTGCHCNKRCIIPSRVVHHWDFQPYPVSMESYTFLTKVHEWPMLNLNEMNPSLYNHIKNLSVAHSKRMQIFHLVRYMLACTSKDSDEFWRRLSSNWHIFQHLHHYSIKELELIKSGTYLLQISDIVRIGMQHVMKCSHCAARGFICEVCHLESDILYPFDVQKTNTCEQCFNVYHKKCWSPDSSIQCLRCARRQRRRQQMNAPLPPSTTLVEGVLFSHPDDMLF